MHSRCAWWMCWLCIGLSGCAAQGPTLNPRLYDAIAASTACEGCPPVGKLPGLTPGPRARDDEHPLLQASEAAQKAVSNVMFFPGGPLASVFGPMQEELAAIQGSLASQYRRLPAAMSPLLAILVKATADFYAARDLEPEVRACLAAYLDAMRRVFTDDPLLVMKTACVAADADGSLETLVATMEMVSLNEAELAGTLGDTDEEAIEELAEKLMREMDLPALQRLAARLGKRMDHRRDVDPPDADLRALLPALNALDGELVRSEAAWKASTLHRLCAGGRTPGTDAVAALLRPRFEHARTLVAARWDRLRRSNPLRSLIEQGKLPSPDAAEVRAELARVRLSVAEGPADHAHFAPQARLITVPNGLAASLCPPQFDRIQQAIRNDRVRAGELRPSPGRERIGFEAFQQAVLGFEAPAALALAEKLEIELLSALDFVVAHELAHALFDDRAQAGVLARGERELRADAFAVAVVDRTSETALLKRVAALSDNDFTPTMPGQPRRPDERSVGERILLATLPGGQALLSVYAGSRLARGGADHPSLGERIDWMERWLVEPLARAGLRPAARR